MKQLVVLTPNRSAPSYRYRIENAFTELKERGWHISVLELREKRRLNPLRRNARLIRSADVVFVAKLKLGFAGAWYLRRLAKHIVFDFDDAIYFRKPQTADERIGRSWPRRAKFRNVCRIADLVIPGNQELANQAMGAAQHIEILPTAIDVDRYPPSRGAEVKPPIGVWVGLPNNLAYLELIRPALVQISKQFENFRLRIISSKRPNWDDVPIEFIPWDPQAEVEGLRSARFGLMPLSDDDWSRGKCAFKLLQYMAASLPCIASPVGANCDAVIEGRTGFLARDTQDWVRAIRWMLDAPAEEIHAMGEAGRRHALEHYSTGVVFKRLATLLDGLAATN